MTKSFQLDIVTPIQSFTFEDVIHVECPGSEGYFGVLKNHTNSSNKTIRFNCSSGIADINSDPSDDLPDKVLLLVENVEQLQE
jgi:F-type H+-transporting ATPase subunit epsilon